MQFPIVLTEGLVVFEIRFTSMLVEALFRCINLNHEFLWFSRLLEFRGELWGFSMRDKLLLLMHRGELYPVFHWIFRKYIDLRDWQWFLLPSVCMPALRRLVILLRIETRPLACLICFDSLSASCHSPTFDCRVLRDILERRWVVGPHKIKQRHLCMLQIDASLNLLLLWDLWHCWCKPVPRAYFSDIKSRW